MTTINAPAPAVEQHRYFAAGGLTSDSVQFVKGLGPATATTKLSDGQQEPVPTHITRAVLCIVGGLTATAYAALLNIEPELSAGLPALKTAMLIGGPLLVTAGVVLCHPLARLLGRGAGTALVIGLTFGAMSVMNATVNLAGHRLTDTANTQVAADQRADAGKEITRLELELAKLPSARVASIVSAEITATFAKTPGLTDCTQRPNWFPSDRQRKACDVIGKLEIEKATATQRVALAGEIKTARAILNGKRDVSGSMPVVIAARLIGLGELNPESVDLVRSLALVILVEALAAMLFAGAGNMRTERAPDFAARRLGQPALQIPLVDPRVHPVQIVQPVRHPVAEAVTVQPQEAEPAKLTVQPEHRGIATQAETPADTAVTATVQPLHSEAPGARQRVLDLIENAGGTVQGGQRAIAAQAGVSITRLRQALDGLVADGTVKVRAGTTATTIVMA